jgi:hypothetical protein
MGIAQGKTLDQVLRDELGMIRHIYDRPTDVQAEHVDALGFKMSDPVIRAADDKTHYANILTNPAYCVGNVSHHIAQSIFNVTEDDVVIGGHR